MQTFDIKEVRNELSRFVDLAVSGESFVVSVGGKDMAVMKALTVEQQAFYSPEKQALLRKVRRA